MPKDFLDCQKSGGKIVTEKLKGNRYRHICYDKKGRHEGEIKTRKKAKSYRNQKNKNQIEKSRVLISDLKRLKSHFDKKRNE